MAVFIIETAAAPNYPEDSFAGARDTGTSARGATQLNLWRLLRYM